MILPPQAGPSHKTARRNQNEFRDRLSKELDVGRVFMRDIYLMRKSIHHYRLLQSFQ